MTTHKEKAEALLKEASDESKNPGYAREEMIRLAQVHATMAILEIFESLKAQAEAEHDR